MQSILDFFLYLNFFGAVNSSPNAISEIILVHFPKELGSTPDQEISLTVSLMTQPSHG